MTASRPVHELAHEVFWLDRERRESQASLDTDIAADLAIVGGGYLGLWTALHAKRRNPRQRVVVLEAQYCGWAASGRNGGFVSWSLTHGSLNGEQHWPGEMRTLQRLGMENLAGFERDLEHFGIDCSFEWTGKVSMATRPHEVAALQESVAVAERHGHHVELLDASAARDLIDSPAFLGGVRDPRGTALVDPVRLVDGLVAACRSLGVEIYEHSPAHRLRDFGDEVVVEAAQGSLRARRVVLATNAFPSLLRTARLYTVPVYDYAIVTEPLTASQRSAIGWDVRMGLTDAGNEFHYSRLTDDDRILWGGGDAIYHFGSGIRPEYDAEPEVFERLQASFLETFPQLSGVRFSHGWGGVIDTCTRFANLYGTGLGGKVAYSIGFTGLGVGATRFAAEVVLDLVEGLRTERTALGMVRRKPLPWPPEPARAIGINVTRASLSRADRNGGRRNLWLKALDAVGVGFSA